MSPTYSKLVSNCYEEIFDTKVNCKDLKINNLFKRCGDNYLSSMGHAIFADQTSSHLGRRQLEEATKKCNKNAIYENHIALTRHWFFEDRKSTRLNSSHT